MLKDCTIKTTEPQPQENALIIPLFCPWDQSLSTSAKFSEKLKLRTPCALQLVETFWLASGNLCFRVFELQLKVINNNFCYLCSVEKINLIKVTHSLFALYLFQNFQRFVIYLKLSGDLLKRSRKNQTSVTIY